MHVILNWYWVYTLIRVTANIKLVLKKYPICDHLKRHKGLLITNRESPGLSLYTVNSVCRTTLETPLGNIQMLLVMKLTNDVTLPFLLEVNNDISVYFLCHSGGL